jgi:dipeptidyl aminopeptidase/acylaminoacyl peptidase
MPTVRTAITLGGAAAFLLVVGSVHVPAQGAEPRRWTVDDVMALKAVSDVAISPDGRRVAYVVTVRDRESNVANSDIWVVATDGGAPRQVTQSPRADRAPQWASDGSWLAFLSDRGGRMQVYGIDPSGGEAWPITQHEFPVASFQLSPDGQRVAFLSRAAAGRPEQDLQRERGRPLVRDSAYASDYTRLFTVTIERRASAHGRLASPEGMDVTGTVWGPDSRTIAYSAKPTPTQRSTHRGAVYVQSEPGAESRRLTTMPGSEQVVAWPEEPGLIFAASGEAAGTSNTKLWVVSPSGTDPVSLTDALDENPAFVSANGRELIVEAATKTGRGVFRIPLAGGRASGPPQRLSDDRQFYSRAAVSATGGMMALVAESPVAPPDVFATAVATFNPRRLTTLNPQADGLPHGETRVLTWKSAADSESIEGVLTLPVGYRSGTRVPLLLVIHGGPAGVSSMRYPNVNAYPIQVFSNLGYAVLQPNYRGSTGYGQRFRGLNKGDISGKDWVDINSGVDALIRDGMVDTTKMGIMGWSFGGHHTFWGIGQTTRYSAASAGAGANDLISMYSQTDIPEFYHTYLGPPPWENFELYEQRSAYRFVKNVTTPLLIQVGENDRRVPAEQSIQYYEAMKGIGKAPVKLVIYPGQPHGISEPRLQRDLMNRNVEWFSYWIPVVGNKPPVRVAGGPGLP